MKPKFKTEGFRDLEKALMDLPRVAAKASVRRVLKQAALLFAEAGRENAPAREGNLRASYGVGTRLTKRQRKVAKRESEVEVFAGPNDPAAIQTEFGNDHQAAEPHLRPAWDAHKVEALDVIKEELAADVEKAVARHQRKAAKRAK